ncbi:MAG: dihydrolipoyl dehydrogenase [Acidobacteriota bacterium]
MTGRRGTRLVVLGAGPGGYTAAFLAADRGLNVTLIDPAPDPGGVCLYRGCIPSKALLHVAAVLQEAREAAAWGITFPAPRIDLDRLRAWKERVVGQLTGGLGQLREKRNVRAIRGRARFRSASSVWIDQGDAGTETVEFDHAIIATGSEPLPLPLLPRDPERIMDSTAALELRDIPGQLLVIGGGYIGLELGSVYAALGSRVSVVEMTPSLLPGVDPDLVRPLARRLDQRFESVRLETRIVAAEAVEGGIHLTLEQAGGERAGQTFDKVLVAVGRRPSADDLGLENTRVEVDPAGFIRVDAQRRTDEPSVFAIGDVAGQPMLAHKAAHEARAAVEALAGQPAVFEPRAIPAVVFTDPEIAWCGLTSTAAAAAGREVEVARFPWAASGRAATLGRSDGLTKLVVDPASERILGVGLTGPGAGELIAAGVLAVEMGARVSDLRLTIHPHPTLSETLMEAADAYFGESTHVYRPRRRPDR